MLSDLAFDQFSRRKTQEAEHATIEPLHTVLDHSAHRQLRAVGNAWTRGHYDGGFHLPDAHPSLPVLTMVFVQSRDGNTVADNPEELGGGDSTRCSSTCRTYRSFCWQARSAAAAAPRRSPLDRGFASFRWILAV
jgi:hypothetical protein